MIPDCKYSRLAARLRDYRQCRGVKPRDIDQCAYQLESAVTLKRQPCLIEAEVRHNAAVDAFLERVTY